jgi:hypothetical protein
VCLACGRGYRRDHYARNVAYYVAKAARADDRRQVENYRKLIAHLRVNPCVDCGETDVRVLQFDHLDPSTKTTEVSRLVLYASWSRALAEIDKCAVRCGNCHRRKTLRDLRITLDRDRSLKKMARVDSDARDNGRRAVSSVDRAAAF